MSALRMLFEKTEGKIFQTIGDTPEIIFKYPHFLQNKFGIEFFKEMTKNFMLVALPSYELKSLIE
jgi:hypothetical protein